MRMIPLTLLVSFVLLGSKPAGAQLYKTLQQSAQCILNYTTDVGSREAVGIIRSACNDLYGTQGFSTKPTDDMISACCNISTAFRIGWPLCRSRPLVGRCIRCSDEGVNAGVRCSLAVYHNGRDSFPLVAEPSPRNSGRSSGH